MAIWAILWVKDIVYSKVIILFTNPNIILLPVAFRIGSKRYSRMCDMVEAVKRWGLCHPCDVIQDGRAHDIRAEQVEKINYAVNNYRRRRHEKYVQILIQCTFFIQNSQI
jgi:hypothetical protein